MLTYLSLWQTVNRMQVAISAMQCWQLIVLCLSVSMETGIGFITAIRESMTQCPCFKSWIKCQISQKKIPRALFSTMAAPSCMNSASTSSLTWPLKTRWKKKTLRRTSIFCLSISVQTVGQRWTKHKHPSRMSTFLCVCVFPVCIFRQPAQRPARSVW